MKEKTVLVTGCTSGIGLYLAREFARHGHDLVLVAPVRKELEIVASELKAAYGTYSHIIARDLELENSPIEIFDALRDAGIEVDILVNNAGLGFRGSFWQIPIEKDEVVVNLNINAILRLTKLFLPPMITRGRGKILNTASATGFEPGTLLAVYHASKAFILSWSEALATELDDTPVTVTALCPGATEIDFFPKTAILDAVAFAKNPVMAPQEIARAAYEGLMKGDLFILPGNSNIPLIAARRMQPDEAPAKLKGKNGNHGRFRKRDATENNPGV